MNIFENSLQFYNLKLTEDQQQQDDGSTQDPNQQQVDPNQGQQQPQQDPNEGQDPTQVDTSGMSDGSDAYNDPATNDPNVNDGPNPGGPVDQNVESPETQNAEQLRRIHIFDELKRVTALLDIIKSENNIYTKFSMDEFERMVLDVLDQFNTFSTDDLNKFNDKCINHLKDNIIILKDTMTENCDVNLDDFLQIKTFNDPDEIISYCLVTLRKYKMYILEKEETVKIFDKVINNAQLFYLLSDTINFLEDYKKANMIQISDCNMKVMTAGSIYRKVNGLYIIDDQLIKFQDSETNFPENPLPLLLSYIPDEKDPVTWCLMLKLAFLLAYRNQFFTPGVYNSAMWFDHIVFRFVKEFFKYDQETYDNLLLRFEKYREDWKQNPEDIAFRILSDKKIHDDDPLYTFAHQIKAAVDYTLEALKSGEDKHLLLFKIISTYNKENDLFNILLKTNPRYDLMAHYKDLTKCLLRRNIFDEFFTDKYFLWKNKLNVQYERHSDTARPIFNN